METILKDIITYGLFNKKNISNSLHSGVFPKKTFGVFVSVKRHQLLTTWPYDIHGCIGYWNKQYHDLDSEEIRKHLLDVSKSATFYDSRKKYFPYSILTDPLSEYWVYFMLNPIKSVDLTTGVMSSGVKFSNKKLGLIVKDMNKTATYLPDVFPDNSWDEIKKSLLAKAGTVNAGAIFFAYDTIIHKLSLLEYIVQPFIDYLIKMDQSFIPYIVHKKVSVIDKGETIKNLVTVACLYNLNPFAHNFGGLQKMIDNTVSYYVKTNRRMTYRESAFLLQVLQLQMKYNLSNAIENNKIIEQIFTRLVNALPQKMMFKFELDTSLAEFVEVLYILCTIRPSDKRLKTKLQWLCENEKKIKLAQIKQDDIFRINWLSKLIPFMEELFDDIYEKYIKLIKTLDLSISETNYIAVYFECACSLFVSANNKLYRTLLSDKIESLYGELHERLDENGLYWFKNGGKRLDITCNVIKGFLTLADSNKKIDLY